MYVLPTAVGGDLFGDLRLANSWLEIGYDRIRVKKPNHLLGLKIGAIVYSQPLHESFFISLNQQYTNGFNVNAEHKIIMSRIFYYSTNIFYQWTKTIRHEENYRMNFITVPGNDYSVYRSVVCLYPKVGFMLINKKYGMTMDFGLGVGIRFVSSYNVDKINTELNNGYEYLVYKEFDRGDKFAQKIYFQIKIGYNF